ncbi:hypothetical protein NECID01_1629 [Nematocida sp. AWRm77]|nr:hypothetical protein NECID01_1629 [Nematocida sp. AWRm77]
MKSCYYVLTCLSFVILAVIASIDRERLRYEESACLVTMMREKFENQSRMLHRKRDIADLYTSEGKERYMESYDMPDCFGVSDTIVNSQKTRPIEKEKMMFAITNLYGSYMWVEDIYMEEEILASDISPEFRSEMERSSYRVIVINNCTGYTVDNILKLVGIHKVRRIDIINSMVKDQNALMNVTQPLDAKIKVNIINPRKLESQANPDHQDA